MGVKQTKSEDEWRETLTPEQFKVCRRAATEPPFSGRYHATKKDGVYRCVCCEAPLFSSATKFDSGTGWPSFYAPVEAERVDTRTDTSHGMRRVEVVCRECEAHLGHVFEDGPAPTHQRYCINSVALELDEDAAPA